MTNWRSVVEAHHARAHENDGYELVVRPGASDVAILTLAERTRFPLTDEFREFYSQIDGFGVTSGADVSWFLVPIEGIEETISSARDWFADTHPELASRFFAFIDWDSGDYTGYLLSEDGSPLPALYDFDHEAYTFDEDQDAAEILIPSDASLLEFLNEE